MTNNDLRLKFKFDTGTNASAVDQATKVEAEEVVDFTDIDCYVEDMNLLLNDLFEKGDISEEVMLKLYEKQEKIEGAVEAQKKDYEEIYFDVELDNTPYIEWLEERLISKG